MAVLLNSYSTNGVSQNSFPEKAIAFYLKKAGLAIEENVLLKDYVNKLYSICNNKTLDIYFTYNGKKFAIEYDGYYFHNNSVDNDIIKNEICKKNNINIIRIREPGLLPLDNISYDYILKDKSKEALCDSLRFITDLLKRKWRIKISFDFNINDDSSKIYKMMNLQPVYNNLEKISPSLLQEWDYLKNSFSPDCVTYKSHKLVWWKCSQGHSWQDTPNHRVSGRGCPICSNRKLLKGYNDLKTLYPKILKYWNYEKNTISPREILGKSGTLVWWKCPKCGYEFQTRVYRQLERKYKCPSCRK